MAAPYWKCPVCGYEAKNEQEKQEHVKKNANEPAHVAYEKKMGKKEG